MHMAFGTCPNVCLGVWIGAISGIDWAIRRVGLSSQINPIEQLWLVLPDQHRDRLDQSKPKSQLEKQASNTRFYDIAVR